MANHIKLACVVLMCIAVVGSHTARALTCGQVNTSLLPCLGYLQNGGSVPPRCCAGVRSIASNARTTEDRRTACNCLKSAAASVRRINQANAVSLPSKCGVNIPYKISASTNCASIK